MQQYGKMGLPLALKRIYREYLSGFKELSSGRNAHAIIVLKDGFSPSKEKIPRRFLKSSVCLQQYSLLFAGLLEKHKQKNILLLLPVGKVHLLSSQPCHPLSACLFSHDFCCLEPHLQYYIHNQTGSQDGRADLYVYFS